MKSYRPLPDKPEFTVLEYPGYREYRVENRTYLNGDGTQGWVGAFFFPVLFAVFWQSVWT